jgi:NAD(P)-dependent dehydrogenase (short-subunit alcohol dehydrogenase family)
LAGRRIVVVGAGTRPSADPDAPIGNGRAYAAIFLLSAESSYITAQSIVVDGGLAQIG